MNTTATITSPSLDQQRAALDSREEMLKTLHLVYRDTLDKLTARNHLRITGKELPPNECRLTFEEQRDLGRRLALYWDMGCETLPKPSPRQFRDHNEEIEALLVEWRKSRSELHGDEGGEVETK